MTCLDLLLKIKEAKDNTQISARDKQVNIQIANIAFFQIQSAVVWKDVVICESPSLFVLNKVAPEQIMDSIVLLVDILNTSLNVQSKLSESQVLEIVVTILSEYPFLKIEQLIFIFKQGKLGRYGANYAKIDITTICEWIDIFWYDEARIKAIEDNAHNKRMTLEAQSKDIEYAPVPSWFLQKLDDHKKKMDFQKKALMTEKIWRTEEDRKIKFEEYKSLLQSTMNIMPEIISTETKKDLQKLAYRISEGDTMFNQEDIQLQANYPKELENMLQEIKISRESNK